MNSFLGFYKKGCTGKVTIMYLNRKRTRLSRDVVFKAQYSYWRRDKTSRVECTDGIRDTDED